MDGCFTTLRKQRNDPNGENHKLKSIGRSSPTRSDMARTTRNGMPAVAAALAITALSILTATAPLTPPSACFSLDRQSTCFTVTTGPWVNPVLALRSDNVALPGQAGFA